MSNVFNELIGAYSLAGSDPLLAAYHSPESPAGQQFMRLQTRLRGAEEQAPGDGRSVVVTSASRADGRSVVAANLALSLCGDAAGDVILVDADLRRSGLAAILGIEPPLGLVDVLAGRAALRDVVVRPHDAPITFLAGGRLGSGDTARIGSAAMGRLTADLRGHFAWTVFDAPPVLLSADAEVMARRADAALLVVRHQHTMRQAARQARDALRGTGVPRIACVVNDVRLPAPRWFAR